MWRQCRECRQASHKDAQGKWGNWTAQEIPPAETVIWCLCPLHVKEKALAIVEADRYFNQIGDEP